MSSSASIHARLQAARDARDESKLTYQARQQALQEVQARLDQTLQQIRTIVIEAIRGGERFDWTDADEQVSALFEQLRARRDSLSTQLEEQKQRASSADAKVRSAVESHEHVAEALAELDRRIDAATEQLPGVPALLRRIDDIELLSERLKQQQDHATTEASEKRQAYEADRYFRYLWERGYGDARYRAGRIASRFDHWLAERCYYSENARQYQLLLAIPERLTATISESTSHLTATRAEVARHRAQVAEEMKRPAAQEAVDVADAALAASKAEASQILQQIRAMQEETEAIAAGKHDMHQRMSAVMDHAFRNRELARFVDATLSIADDALLQHYDADCRRQEQLQAGLTVLRTRRQALDSEVSELDAAYRRAKSAEAAARLASVRRSRSHAGSGSSGSHGGFGGGGISSGGGFGGGGHSTGGGFGGGGYRTGGGF